MNAPISTARVTREGDMVTIHLPMSEVHGLRVALHTCPCKAAKSHETIAIRDRLDKALARIESAQ